jgi:hypothetical protein
MKHFGRKVLGLSGGVLVADGLFCPAILHLREGLESPDSVLGLALLPPFWIASALAGLVVLVSAGDPYWPLPIARGAAGVVAFIEIWRLALLGVKASGEAAAGAGRS